MANRASIIVRAVGVIAATSALVTGVTWAALTSNTATLTSTTINSATASLKLWDGDSFETSAPGFTITGLVPGTGSEQAFYFQNDGEVPLKLKAKIPALPSSSGFAGWENAKVTFTDEQNNTTVTTDMLALSTGDGVELPGDLTAGAQGNSAAAGTEGNFKAKFDIAPSSITGGQVTIDAFNIEFTGTQPAS